jgi:hypothetical protein
MVIFLPVLFMLVTALALTILRFAHPGFKYSWMLGTGGASLALASVFAWKIRFPHIFFLPPWQPSTVFRYFPTWLADDTSWPYAVALAALAVAVIWTSVVRLENEPQSWAGTLLLCAAGILAVTAGDPLTLVLTWTALDAAELVTMLRSTEGESENRSVAISLATRLAGTGLVLLACVLSIGAGMQLDFSTAQGSAGLALLLASALRLGVLPLHLPYHRENVLRRGFGTTLRLVTAAASLALLARIPPNAIESRLTPLLALLAAIAALYAGWMWLRASDEVIGRPFWVLGLASLAVSASLRGDTLGSTGWGVTLVLGGALLFLFSARKRSVLWLLPAGLWGLSALPFSPTASAWVLGEGASWALMLPFPVAQALFMAGFIRHGLHPGEASLESQERWVQAIYPAGLLIPSAVLVLLGLWGWPGAGMIGSWLVGGIVILLAAGLVALTGRLLAQRMPAGDSAQWIHLFRLGWFLRLLDRLFGWLRRLADLITSTLEGEGGLLWSFLLLVLIISVLSTGGQP